NGVPVTRQLLGDIRDRSTPPDLLSRPLRAPRRQPAVLGRDAVITQGPRPTRAGWLRTAQPVFAPGQDHRAPEDRQVHIANHRAGLDLRPNATVRAVRQHLGPLDPPIFTR